MGWGWVPRLLWLLLGVQRKEWEQERRVALSVGLLLPVAFLFVVLGP